MPAPLPALRPVPPALKPLPYAEPPPTRVGEFSAKPRPQAFDARPLPRVVDALPLPPEPDAPAPLTNAEVLNRILEQSASQTGITLPPSAYFRDPENDALYNPESEKFGDLPYNNPSAPLTDTWRVPITNLPASFTVFTARALLRTNFTSVSGGVRTTTWETNPRTYEYPVVTGRPLYWEIRESRVEGGTGSPQSWYVNRRIFIWWQSGTSINSFQVVNFVQFPQFGLTYSGNSQEIQTLRIVISGTSYDTPYVENRTPPAFPTSSPNDAVPATDARPKAVPDSIPVPVPVPIPIPFPSDLTDAPPIPVPVPIPVVPIDPDIPIPPTDREYPAPTRPPALPGNPRPAPEPGSPRLPLPIPIPYPAPEPEEPRKLPPPPYDICEAECLSGGTEGGTATPIALVRYTIDDPAPDQEMDCTTSVLAQFSLPFPENIAAIEVFYDELEANIDVWGADGVGNIHTQLGTITLAINGAPIQTYTLSRFQSCRLEVPYVAGSIVQVYLKPHIACRVFLSDTGERWQFARITNTDVLPQISASELI